MSNEERFVELAQKALSKKAQPSEEAELRALLAASPKLKNDFEQMGAEAAAAREILPLLEDIEHPQGPIPPAPMARLRREVRAVFAERETGRSGLRDLLAELEKWVRRDPAPATRQEGASLVQALQELLLGGAVLSEDTASYEPAPRRLREASFAALAASPPSPSMPPPAAGAAGRTPRREVRKRQGELIAGLEQVEKRLSQALEHLHSSGMEAERVLEAIRRERKILEEMSAKESDRPVGGSA
ncbi:MAG TPA: hypothetical protein P5205_22095 [Candidatus Paceibacterota bacterium]|nr:hypothetical protein [Verrucomicrobiota bacterium]HSA13052.1 hypothetical protein [Candidatus Paceibacterota bacterium]